MLSQHGATAIALADPDLQQQLKSGAVLRFNHKSGAFVLEYPISKLHERDTTTRDHSSTMSGKGLPAYLRMPKSGERCVHTGLTRSMMDSLIRPCAANNFRPPVKSSKVKSAGANGNRGAVLIDANSLIEYLARQERAGAAVNHEA